MSAFDDRLQRRVLGLQVRLYACCARLSAGTDGEALHDLRIALRRLASLLRPLRREPLCAALEQAVTVLNRASGPLRDIEVLAHELEAQGLSGPAALRRDCLAEAYVELLAGVPLRGLMVRLDEWPEDCRQARRHGQWRARGKRVARHLDRLARKLAMALRDPAHDRHRLRLLIKRLRYCAEAWPAYYQLEPARLRSLRRAQAALGHWHDHWQWLQRLEIETDLGPCAGIWRQRLLDAEREADLALLELCEFFPQVPAQSR
ncbi:CHAD domain-containing protein [Pseudomonas sp. CAU 1711]|uniref:CHAD domain-containing protein n=1 Tax=Pseudomonas sp. CAU 1711 TaxID=3140356 RepID=UPI003260E1BF